MPSATVNGATLSYQWDGAETKPVLVLSNSLTTDMRMWEPLLPAFTEHFRVLRYNNRGHGGSSSPAGEYTMNDIAGDALALMDYLDIPTAQFCGLSMGGMVGMWLGLHAPDRVQKLVICNTSSDVGSPSHGLQGSRQSKTVECRQLRKPALNVFSPRSTDPLEAVRWKWCVPCCWTVTWGVTVDVLQLFGICRLQINSDRLRMRY